MEEAEYGVDSTIFRMSSVEFLQSMFHSISVAMALLIALACYTLFVRVTRSSGNNGGSGGNSSRGGRWGRGGGGGGGRGGPNIKGVKDLPCDPKGG